MIFRLLALNVDGTLLTQNGRIHKSTKEAVEYVQQKGVLVTIVTSRSYSSVRKLAKTLNLTGPIITHRGAFISSVLDKPIFVKRIGEEITLELVRFFEGFQCQIRLIHEKFTLANKFKHEKNFIGKTVISPHDYMYYNQQYVDSISETLIDDPVNPLHLEVKFEHHQDLKDAQIAISGMFSEVDTVKTTDLTLEIVSSHVSKLSGLIYLGEHLEILPKEMVVIGDGVDDIPMIKTAGLGVAMGNASFPVKKAADWVTRSNQEQGVAYMVKEHFRKQHPIDFLRKMNILK
ncbi:HAD family phosphatase [Bacillus aquiflavi]|uniref:HAD family phosphatase n=1 Tax=Bacillus aquiflavi TaxID=2672567 RepID=A0A6B3VXF2_9BACI|nr:Cof-type HAD-IIB family hydrolase [Bacillus aquiflavi]MBA4535648.1 HAD family phosphatase [Bacillus aquiflavi]NEY80024.1 HAD family phosphatase [Bacillus aquiflavi]